MKLDRRWKDILKRAWSVRLMLLAGLLTGLEMIIPFYFDLFPRHIFAVLAILVSIAALLARVVAQRGL